MSDVTAKSAAAPPSAKRTAQPGETADAGELRDPLCQRMFVRINEQRAVYSIPPLELDSRLSLIAQAHCADMAQRGFLAPVSPEGRDATSRAQEVDYTSRVYQLVGEGTDPDEALAGWVANAAYRAQLISDANRGLGVGRCGCKWAVVLGAAAVARRQVPAQRPEEPQRELLSLVNRQRVETEAPPLRLHLELERAALAHAADMAVKSFVAYDHPGVPGLSLRVKESGYRGRIFQVITKGPANAEAVLKLFLASEGPRKNLLDPDFADFAAAARDGTWVLLLGAPPPEAGSDLRSEFLGLVNAQRSTVSALALAQSPILARVAQDYAQDMARRDFFAGTNPEGKGPDSLARLAGFSGRVLCMLIRGANTSEAALGAWMKSPQSRASLLDSQFSSLGLGVAESRWVLLLGTSNS